ncbi:MAG: HAMP domain-containing protein [Gammaproteobacteria bacterium]|nr:HAMP domain-containing protein [Gammaproteobacteria bacterium]
MLKMSYLPIVFKLSLVITVLLVASTIIQGTLISSNQSQLLEEQIHDFGNSLTTQITQQFQEPLLSQDMLTIESIISSSLKIKNIHGIQVISTDGKMIISRGDALADIPKKQLMNDGSNYFLWQGGKSKDIDFISFIGRAVSNKISLGYVLVSFDRTILAEAKKTSRLAIIGSTFLMMVIGLFSAYLLSKLITRPIYKIIRTSGAIADGDYETRFNENYNDELGVLNDSLNTMTQGLIHKAVVEQALSRYVSPKVAKEVLTDTDARELGGRSVNASVIFADIVGFTQMSEEMTADEVSTLLNTYFSYIDLASHICHGHVDKYIGDCAMLLFGAPEDDSDHVFHAVYCSILIQRVIEKLNAKRLSQGKRVVEFRIGVNAGRMLAGNMGSMSRMEYTVLGDAVNLASRLTSKAAPSAILVNDSIALDENIRSRIKFEYNEKLSIKGMLDLVNTYSIKAVLPELESRLNIDIETVLSTSLENQ